MRNRDWSRQYKRLQQVRDLIPMRLVVGEPVIDGNKCTVPLKQMLTVEDVKLKPASERSESNVKPHGGLDSNDISVANQNEFSANDVNIETQNMFSADSSRVEMQDKLAIDDRNVGSMTLQDELVINGRSIGSAALLDEVLINGRNCGVSLRQALNEREVEYDFSFEWEADGVALTNDFVVIHVGYEVGSMYKAIDLDFAISEKTLNQLKEITEAEITAPEVISLPVTIENGSSYAAALNSMTESSTRSKWAMSFSGGMDSTALRVMCPELVATTALFTDPSAVEQVEHDVCEKLGTNFVTGTAREHIGRQTLGGAIVLGMMPFVEKEQIGLIATGKLHTDNVQYLLRIRDGQRVWREAKELAFGVKQTDVMMGFTKAGVYDVLNRLDKETYEIIVPAYFKADDLEANNNIGRYLFDAATTGVERIVDMSLEHKLSWHINIYFGHYALKKLGRTVLQKYMSDIPEGAEAQTEGMSLDFMLKYDQEMLNALPEDFKQYFVSKLEAAGVQFFTEADYAERQALLELAFGPAKS